MLLYLLHLILHDSSLQTALSENKTWTDVSSPDVSSGLKYCFNQIFVLVSFRSQGLSPFLFLIHFTWQHNITTRVEPPENQNFGKFYFLLRTADVFTCDTLRFWETTFRLSATTDFCRQMILYLTSLLDVFSAGFSSWSCDWLICVAGLIAHVWGTELPGWTVLQV